MSESSRTSLRKAMRALRRQRAEAGLASFPLREEFFSEIAAFSCIGGYYPMAGEPDILPLLAACESRGQSTALPRFASRTTPMEFALWRQGDSLEPISFGFKQPAPDAPIAEPDCLLVPLVAFDASGNRLGQGAGHYDRYLAHHGTVAKIGVAWSFQQAEAIARESWDVPMDAILTETGLIRVSSRI